MKIQHINTPKIHLNYTNDTPRVIKSQLNDDKNQMAIIKHKKDKIIVCYRQQPKWEKIIYASFLFRQCLKNQERMIHSC